MRLTKPSKSLFLLIIILASLVGVATPGMTASIGSGELFPEVPLPAPLEEAQREYLGLSNDQPFTISQIKGRIALVEILNVHCPHCKKQVKPYNDLYRMIETDPETRGKIKMVGVAVANDDEAIDDFMVIYSVAYPIIPDRTFKLYSKLQAGQTPFSLYMLRDSTTDPFVITDTHLGNDEKIEELFSYLKDLLQMESSEFISTVQEVAVSTEKLMPPQQKTQIEQMIAATFSQYGEVVGSPRKLDLPSKRWVYTATVKVAGHSKRLFAEVSSRSAICDVCHDVHFFYVFDQSGLVIDFIPLDVTKHGNVNWNQTEIEKFKKRVVGRQLMGKWNFDPTVDAIASATMTAAIIFDEFAQGDELFNELSDQNLLQP